GEALLSVKRVKKVTSQNDFDCPVPQQILDLIKRLAQANIYHVDSASSTDILNLIQLLHVATLENLEQLWKEVSGNDEHRFKAGDITANEAGQALVVAFNHLSAEPVSVEFLAIPFSKSHPCFVCFLYVLAYGPLVYRYCVYTDPCPITVVQPLLDMATSGLSKNTEEDMILALKALGNAAHPSSIKTLLKFLPGYTAGAEKLPTRVQSAAVQSFRLLASRDPHSVMQDIVLNLFVQRTHPAEIRMLACMVLLETKPSIALIPVISEVLLEEIDLQIASFSYSLLKGISKSRTPDNQHITSELSSFLFFLLKISTACNIAIKILTPKLGHLSYRYSKNAHLDWFHDDFLFWTSADIYMLQNESLFGFCADGLKELLAGKIPQLKKDLGITDFATIMTILSDWQNLPKDRPLLTAYARMFGQEAFLMDVRGDSIQSIIKSFSPSAGKESKVWGTAGSCHSKAEINPTPKEHLGELLSSDISLHTDGFAGVTKDHFVFHGINTDLFQCGTEMKSKIVSALPWAFDLKINRKEQKYEMNLTPIKVSPNILMISHSTSNSSNVFSVLRNIEDPSLFKITPMMPETEDSQQGLPLASILPTSRDDKVQQPSQYHIAKMEMFGKSCKLNGCVFCSRQRILRIQEYVPGISYIMGFYQKYEKNPERQAAVTVVASSPETFDMRVKILEVVVLRTHHISFLIQICLIAFLCELNHINLTG
uniref:Vitellogenin 3, phosvitinless n=1 Tax=Sinocyclocheilus grahami TaxID=75366 RepID=A0A672SJC0_SINGR